MNVNVLELQATFGVWIVRSFLCTPSGVGCYMIHIVSLTFDLQHPHWDVWICQMSFIEVEDYFLVVLQFKLHKIVQFSRQYHKFVVR